MSVKKVQVETGKGLKSITLKPTVRCNANCVFCEQRLDHYKKTSNKIDIAFDDWTKIVDEAISLGIKSVNISGGEPTLYPRLIDLIKACKAKSVEVNLKSNGYLIDKNFAKKLALANLDSCTISIYSHSESVHDKIKSIKGSHKAAVNALKCLAEEGIDTYLQTVLTREMLGSFDKYLKWAVSLKVDVLFVSYLEGNGNVSKPNEYEIKDFVNNIVPKSKEILKKSLANEPLLLEEGLNTLDGLFDFREISHGQIAKGVYNLTTLKGCGRNHSMAILLSNGEIHPCNAVEYFHMPIAGDLNQISLTEAWNSEIWEKVKKGGPGWCKICPMNRHTSIKFKKDVDINAFYSTP